MKGKLKKYIDKKLGDKGYVKTREEKCSICYEKFFKKQQYIHCLEITKDELGRKMIYSYNKKIKKNGKDECYRESIGIEADIVRLLELRSRITF